MRIMYLTESMGWSGGAQQVLLMAGALHRRGHRLVVACQPGSEILSRAEAAGLSVERVRIRQDYDVPAAWNVAGLLKSRRVELLHAHHPTAHAIGLMAAAWTRLPVFAVTRRVIFPLKRNLFSRLKYLSRRVDGYVAVAEAVRSELRKGGVADSRIEVIPSVMEVPNASAEEGAALRRELGLAEGPLITTVANYADFKGQDYLVRAAASVCRRFPRCQFLLAGRNTEQLQPLVAQLGLARSVHLAGFRADVPRILAATDLFVLPSLQEAAGTALREAMAAGVPCIGTSVGGIPEVLKDGETGLLAPPADADALAAAIIRLLEQPELAQSLADRGKAFASERFSLEPAAARMEAFYRRLLDGTSQK